VGLVVSGRAGPLGACGGWRGAWVVCGRAGDGRFLVAAGPVGGALSAAGPLGGDFIGAEFASVIGGFGGG
jgi:hypothetical protein